MRDYKPIVNQAAFAKLYPVKVPCPAYFDYYIRRLLEALDLPLPLGYDWLPAALEDFAALEAIEKDISSLVHKTRQAMVADLTSGLNMEPVPSFEFSQKDTVASAAGQRMGRIDLVSANYSALRTAKPSLPATWGAYCEGLAIPKAIARSKSFRQSVLGYLNPKWQQRVEMRAIAATITLIESFMPRFRERLVRCSHDEIVFTVESDAEVWFFFEIAKGCELPARFELFELQRLSFAKAFTWTSLSFTATDNSATSGSPKSLQPFMLPANRFYLWLTRVVYQQLVQDDRDITYLEDGQTARWAYDYNRAPAHVSLPQTKGHGA